MTIASTDFKFVVEIISSRTFPLDNLTVAQLFKKLTFFYRNQRRIIVSTRIPSPRLLVRQCQKFERPPFGMVQATGLKIMICNHIGWHALHTEFHENLPVGSDVILGDRHRQQVYLINLLIFL
jgi:hypothetical protein